MANALDWLLCFATQPWLISPCLKPGALRRFPVKEGRGHRDVWACKCVCGRVANIKQNNLKNGNSKSCGCQKGYQKRKNNPILIGKRFGRWLVLGDCKAQKPGQYYWLCQCDCGTKKQVREFYLLNGASKSCGCVARETYLGEQGTHGYTGTPSYYSWAGMIERCTNSNHQHWKFYGGRGISVCDRWISSFENFLADMGEKPKGLSLDRIDVNGDYCAENCRWIDQKGQMRNTRANHRFPRNGWKLRPPL
jgi:hypothetical protein